MSVGALLPADADGSELQRFAPDVVTSSKFVVEAAGCELAIRSCNQTESCEASFEHPDGQPAPQITGNNGTLVLRRPRIETRLPFIVRTHRWRADVSLKRDIIWRLRVEGDSNHAMLSLGDAWLSLIEIVGASNTAQIILPIPAGPLSVVLNGGGSTVNLITQASVPVAIRICGAGSRLRVDGLRILGALDQLSWRDSRYMESANRIHVRATGAACAINLIRRDDRP
jgi:hypothetical protein